MVPLQPSLVLPTSLVPLQSSLLPPTCGFRVSGHQTRVLDESVLSFEIRIPSFVYNQNSRDQADEVKNPGQDFKANEAYLLTVRRRKAEDREG
jgi:hypothetical protein